MAIDLARDGLYASIDDAMENCTLPLWEKVVASWNEWPPGYIAMARLGGHKPKRAVVPNAGVEEPITRQFDWDALGKPLDPEIAAQLRG